MKKNTKIILTTLILPWLIAELLTGSSPPLEYFNLITFLFNIFLYGCWVLLIREAKVKWNLQWSIIFLVLAYWILEEWLTTKALFNINWADVGIYANYKTYFGILFPWSIVLLTFHATVSTLIPLLIVDLTWPEFQKKSLLNKNWIIYSFACLISVSLVGLSFMGTIINNKMIPYYPNPLLLIWSFFLILFFMVMIVDVITVGEGSQPLGLEDG